MTTSLPPSPPRAYRIERFIGRGGFGNVYLAQPLSQGTLGRVALKVMAEGATEEWVARFYHEAQVLSSLSGYPNFVHVQAVFRMERRFCIDMEYVPGLTLDRLLSRLGRLPEAVALQITRQVALALDAASNRARDGAGELLRVLHRDMKPGNLRLGAGGVVRILDFGLARSEIRGIRPDTQNVLPATLAYMAPERVGFRADFGAPADVYALGLTLYEMLAGQPFFPDPTVSSFLLASHPLLRTLTAERIEELSGDSSPEVRALLARMLAIPTDARATAAETERACRELLGVGGDDVWREWVESTLAPLEREDPGDPMPDPWGWVGTVRRSDADRDPAPAEVAPSRSHASETFQVDNPTPTLAAPLSEDRPGPSPWRGRVLVLLALLVAGGLGLLLRGEERPWYLDRDGDGYGTGAAVLSREASLPGYARQAGDCDDARGDVHPGAAERCDGFDQDCDGQIDQGLPVKTWYRDADGDGLGAEAFSSCASAPPEGAVAAGGDCDDADPRRGVDCSRGRGAIPPGPQSAVAIPVAAPATSQGQVAMIGAEATQVRLSGPSTLILRPGESRAVPVGTYTAVVEFEGGDYTVSVQVVADGTLSFDCTQRRMGSPCQVR